MQIKCKGKRLLLKLIIPWFSIYFLMKMHSFPVDVFKKNEHSSTYLIIYLVIDWDWPGTWIIFFFNFWSDCKHISRYCKNWPRKKYFQRTSWSKNWEAGTMYNVLLQILASWTNQILLLGFDLWSFWRQLRLTDIITI